MGAGFILDENMFSLQGNDSLLTTKNKNKLRYCGENNDLLESPENQ